MKYVWTILVAVLLVACTAPSEELARATVNQEAVPTQLSGETRAVDVASSTVEFEGYAPGKSHVGTFENWTGNITYRNDSMVGANIVIDVTSLDTGIGRLDEHLRGDAFFATEEHPRARFETTRIENGEAMGSLKMKGVTNTVSFPITVTEDEVSANFIVTLSSWGIEHPAANDEARIAFNVST